MFEYFIKRLLLILPKLLIITVIIFLGLQLIPVDPLAISMDPEVYSNLTEHQKEEMREEKGLNDPAPIRYVRWLGGLLKGDFGYSLISGAPIIEVLAMRLPATLEICIFALILSALAGIVMGSLSAIRKNTIVDYANTTLGLIGTSVPEFFFGMCFIMLFALKLGWLPFGGRMTIGHTDFLDRIQYMIMPSVCLSIGLVAYILRLTRNSMLDVINKDYVKTARAKGETEGNIFVKHVFRNGCAPVTIALIGRISLLVSGTTVIETVFNYPGMGMLLVDSITSNDMPVAMIVMLLCSVVVLLSSFLGDIAIALLDPRVRFGKEQ